MYKLLFNLLGQERFRSLAPMYYKGSKAAVVVYDITVYVNLTIIFKIYKKINRKHSKVQKNGSFKQNNLMYVEFDNFLKG